MSNREAATLAAILVAYTFGVTALAVYVHIACGVVGAMLFMFITAAFKRVR